MRYHLDRDIKFVSCLEQRMRVSPYFQVFEEIEKLGRI